MKRPQPHPPHTGGTFHRRLQPLYTEKHTISCSSFLPNTIPMQRSCSHYNTFRSMTRLTHMYFCTWQHQITTIMQPFQCDPPPQIQETHRTTHTGTLVAEHRGGTNLRMKRPQPHPPHTGSTFHRRLQPHYTEKHTVWCSGFLPQKSPRATFMQPSQSILQHDVSHYCFVM